MEPNAYRERKKYCDGSRRLDLDATFGNGQNNLKNAERWTVTLFLWIEASRCKITVKSQGLDNHGQGKVKLIEGAEKELYHQWVRRLQSHTFLLGKEVYDIRTVYNGIYSVFEKVLLFSHFMIPNMSTHMIEIQIGINMGDIDIKIISKSMMHKILKNICRVDVM